MPVDCQMCCSLSPSLSLSLSLFQYSYEWGGPEQGFPPDSWKKWKRLFQNCRGKKMWTIIRHRVRKREFYFFNFGLRLSCALTRVYVYHIYTFCVDFYSWSKVFGGMQMWSDSLLPQTSFISYRKHSGVPGNLSTFLNKTLTNMLSLHCQSRGSG